MRGLSLTFIVSSPLIVYLISQVGISNTFIITGTFYLITMLFCSLYLGLPAESQQKELDPSRNVTQLTQGEFSAGEAVKTRRFWYLWGMFFINICCGIAIISVASPMAQEYTGMTAIAAATMVGIMGLFNGAGRIGWASISDKIGRPAVFTSFFLLQILAFLLLPNIKNDLLFQILIFLIISCYGGGFASMPVFIKDLFGVRQLGIIFGYVLTAWAAAGMVGPLFAAWARSGSSSYNGTLYFFAALLAVAAVLSILMKRELISLKKDKEAFESTLNKEKELG